MWEIRATVVFRAFLFAVIFIDPTLMASQPAFEVATVKPSPANAARSRYPRLQNHTMTAENLSMRRLLSAAFGLIDMRVVGPDWIDSDKFDLSAKSPAGVPDTELMPMLQALLRDRFGMVVHRSLREAAVYEMFPGKEGVKIQPFDPAHPPQTPQNAGQSVIMGASTMQQLADMLSNGAGRPVLDKTGIPGVFGYVLSFAPLSTETAEKPAGSGAPDFFTAVQQQLGLKLEPKRESIEFLIVDHAERVPSGN